MKSVVVFLIFCFMIACGSSKSRLDPDNNLACALVKAAAPKAECFPLYTDAGDARVYTARVILPDESQVIASYSLTKPAELEIKGFIGGKQAPAAPTPAPTTTPSLDAGTATSDAAKK